MNNVTEICDTKVLWDTSADKLYVWDGVSKRWALFFVAADLITGEVFEDRLAGKLDAAGGAIIGSLSIGDQLAVGAGAVLGGTLAAPQIAVNGVAITSYDGSLYAGGGKIWMQGNDGAGSGLDADQLDGHDSGHFATAASLAEYLPASVYTASDVLAKLRTVDGAGSGLDADQLDGHDSGYFTDIVARLGYAPFNQAGGTIAGNTSIQGLFDVSGDARFLGQVIMPGGGRLASQRWFIASGTWTRPQSVRYVLVFCLGGGGGGGGAAGATGCAACGGGGGAGAMAVKFIDVSAVSSVAVTVGAGGSAGSASGGSGGSGGTSSFGAYCSADGGTGGGGQAAGNYAQAVAGGYGGNASGGDFNFTGGAGGAGIRLDYQNGIAGRGASAAMFGGGGNGYAGNAAGQAGIARGDGGGGGVVANNATGQAGGGGATGMVWIWEYQ